jgi:predicted nucleotide-binding protein
MKQDETALRREQIKEVEEVIFSVCKGKGWEASVSSQDEENWKYATISVSKVASRGRVNGTFEVTLDDGFRMVPDLVVDFNSLLNTGGWEELIREVNIQVMKIPWLKTKASITKETQETQPEEANQTPISEQEIHKLYGAIRSEFVHLPTQSIRNVAAAAGIDVTRITSKAEKKSGIGSRAEIMPQVDSLFGEMDIENKMTALKIITQRVIEDRTDVKEKVESILEKHGFRFKDGQFNRIRKSKSSKPTTNDKQPSKNEAKEEMTDIVKDPANVFVVHGRNNNAKKAIFSFLRSIGLKPLEWSQIIVDMKAVSPHISEILDHAFYEAQAVVVLMTPDDEARLRKLFRKADDQVHEINPTPQARPNVLFEAGMAFGRFPDRTILVELGKLRPFSDIAGRHTVKLDNSTEKRQDLAQRLQNAGCPVNINGVDWHTEGKFDEALLYDLRADEPWKEVADKRPSNHEF